MKSLGKMRRQSSQGPQTPGCQGAETGTSLHTHKGESVDIAYSISRETCVHVLEEDQCKK